MVDLTAIAEEMLPTVKVACRATSELFDPEITACIQAALADMLRAGVSEKCFVEDGNDFWHLILMAVIVYSKAHFGQDNPNAEMGYFRESYERLVNRLMNSAANSAAEEDEPDTEPDPEPSDGGDGE